MLINVKLKFDQNDEEEVNLAQETYDTICNINLVLGMQGCKYINASFIDCGEDGIEVNIDREFTVKELNDLKNSIDEVSMAFSEVFN